MLSPKTLILSSISLTALVATPAFGQAAAPVDTTPQKTQESEQTPPTSTTTNAEGEAANKGAIVITGSRIRRDNFSSPQNVDIVTRNDTVLAGSNSTGDTLQAATITSGTSQINGAFLGFVSEGGAAASTIGLRGFGSTRTLTLLNGRRLAPAGVGNQLIAADLNVLPTSVVQRIEVLREGASSIYGSDAIAGVINVITDTSINGVTIDGFASHPLIGAGDVFRGSITAGKTFSRGHIMGSFEVREKEGMRQGDNPHMRCPRDLFKINNSAPGFEANGPEVGQIDPSTGKLRCFPFQYDPLGIASGYGIAAFFNAGFASRISFPGYTTGQPVIGPPVAVNNNNLRPPPSQVQLESTVDSPVKTYTGYVNGSYDLGILGDSELYGEALYTRRQSKQQGAYQINLNGNGLDFNQIQVYGGTYLGYPLQDFGVGVSPFFPTSWAAAGVNRFTPFIVPQELQTAKQRVDFFRGNAGLRGNVGLGDWRYDANFQVSRTRSEENLVNPRVSTLTNALIAVPAPSGTPSQYIVTALPGQVGAGTGYTCQSNITNGAYNGGTCAPLNFFDPQVLLFGKVPQATFDYIMQHNIDRTAFDQNTFEITFDGSLFRLPGGDAKAAFGFVHRYDHIKDVPSEAALAGDLYNRASAGITQGSDILNEGYGEINLPFLRDRPFAHTLEVDLSGRYTHYRSYGSDFTYHLNAQWAPTDIIRFRGNYGTNFRAPNLYEQFVADQTGFYPPSVDPCNGFALSFAPGSTRYNNCLAALSPILGNAGALAFISTAGPQVTTHGGAGALKSEHAKTWGLGTVITAPRHIADFSLAIDYWDIKVQDEVSVLGSLILTLCYDAADFPNNRYCDLIGPRLPASDSQRGNLTTLSNPYINVSSQSASGLDFDARYATRMFGGRFSTQLQATRNLHQRLQLFAGDTNYDYNGTPGFAGFGAGPKWVGQLDTRFTTANNITFRWGVKYIGKSNAKRLVDQYLTNGQIKLAGPPVTLADFDLVAEPYWEHGVSVQWQWRNVGEFTLGVKNLFDAHPPIIGGFPFSAGQFYRIGNYCGCGDYDFYGRSVFMNVTKQF